jgi:hypothetical protein
VASEEDAFAAPEVWIDCYSGCSQAIHGA